VIAVCLEAVATFARVMGDENLVTVPISIDVFGTELIPITLKRNDLRGSLPGWRLALHSFVSISSAS